MVPLDDWSDLLIAAVLLFERLALLVLLALSVAHLDCILLPIVVNIEDDFWTLLILSFIFLLIFSLLFLVFRDFFFLFFADENVADLLLVAPHPFIGDLSEEDVLVASVDVDGVVARDALRFSEREIALLLLGHHQVLIAPRHIAVRQFLPPFLDYELWDRGGLLQMLLLLFNLFNNLVLATVTIISPLLMNCIETLRGPVLANAKAILVQSDEAVVSFRIRSSSRPNLSRIAVQNPVLELLRMHLALVKHYLSIALSLDKT